MRNNQGLCKCQLLAPPTVRNRLKVALNALSLHRWWKETPWPPAFTKKKKKVSASSVLWLQTHFLRQEYCASLQDELSRQLISCFSENKLAYLCHNNFSTNSIYQNAAVWPENVSTFAAAAPVNSQWTTELRWEFEVFFFLMVLSIVSVPRIAIITTLLSQWRAIRRNQWQLIRYLVRMK